MPREPAEVAEVAGLEHRSAGQADQRVAVAGEVERETGAVVSAEVRR